MKKLIIIIILFTGILPNFIFADQYPNTSIGILDLNRVLTESKSALDAAKQIDVMQKKVENEAKEQDDSIIKERETGAYECRRPTKRTKKADFIAQNNTAVEKNKCLINISGL